MSRELTYDKRKCEEMGSTTPRSQLVGGMEVSEVNSLIESPDKSLTTLQACTNHTKGCLTAVAFVSSQCVRL